MKSVVIPVVVAGLTAAVTLLLTRASDAANRRRDRYAAAVTTLAAWIEFPYRVRRRTDDEPATLAALVSRGHDLQGELACHRAWIATENHDVAAAYTEVRSAIGKLVGAAVREAWDSPPANTASDMNLGEWGPAQACQQSIADMEAAIANRFGWKRFRHFLID